MTIANAQYKSTIETLTIGLAFATFVIGTLGVAGHIPNPALGWITVGIGASAIGLSVAYWANDATASNTVRLVFQVFYGLILLTIGILGGLNVLTFKQTGWILVPPSLTNFLVLSCVLCCAGCCAANKICG